MKRPAPLQVKWPNSDFQVLRLHRNQHIELMFDTDKPVPKIWIFGKHLELDNSCIYQFKKVIKTVITRNYFGTNRASTYFLGEIEIEGRKLIVYLESDIASKVDFVTVLNPFAETIRIKPHQILEVVLCVEPSNAWDWAWIPDTTNEKVHKTVSLEEIGYRFVSTTNMKWNQMEPSDPYYVFDRRPTNQITYVQQHWWFRFDKSLLGLLEADSVGRNSKVGYLMFSNKSNEEHYFIDILADLEKKYVQPFVNTLTLSKYKLGVTTSPITVKQNKVNALIIPGDTEKSTPLNWKHGKKYETDNYDEIYGYGDDDTWIINEKKESKAYTGSSFKKSKHVDKLKLEVEIQQLNSDFDGCIVQDWDVKTEVKETVEQTAEHGTQG